MEQNKIAESAAKSEGGFGQNAPRRCKSLFHLRCTPRLSCRQKHPQTGVDRITASTVVHQDQQVMAVPITKDIPPRRWRLNSSTQKKTRKTFRCFNKVPYLLLHHLSSASSQQLQPISDNRHEHHVRAIKKKYAGHRHAFRSRHVRAWHDTTCQGRGSSVSSQKIRAAYTYIDESRTIPPRGRLATALPPIARTRS